MFSLRDVLRHLFGGANKKKSSFATEREAYDFVRRVYKDSGGVTPELRSMYEFYQKSLNDQCAPEEVERRDLAPRGERAVVTVQLRRQPDRQLGEKLRA